jgi:hypothetical protein
VAGNERGLATPDLAERDDALPKQRPLRELVNALGRSSETLRKPGMTFKRAIVVGLAAATLA